MENVRSATRVEQEREVIGVMGVMAQAALRYDEMMNVAVRLSDNADVNRYLLHPLAEFVASPGKRMRPMLCELGCMMVGGGASDVWGVASALECFHAAALIHDDVEDGSLTRRGRPCYHVAEGIPLAVNAGDYGLALAFSLVFDDAGLSDSVRLRVLAELTEMAKRTIEGQAVDIGWARDGRYDVAVEDYLFVAEGKSAYYSCAAPLALGAIVGGGTDAQVEALRKVGMKVGVAFQIRDDLLNLQGDSACVGKDVLSDILEGKRTIVLLHALEASTQAEELRILLDKPEKGEGDVLAVLDILRESGSIEFAEAAVERLCDESLDLIRTGFSASVPRNVLAQLALFAARRDS